VNNARALLVNEIRRGWPTQAAFCSDAKIDQASLSSYVTGARGLHPETAWAILTTLRTQGSTTLTLEALLGVE
jgi:hypothetical protein